MTRKITVCALALSIAPVYVAAQEHPNQAGGFAAPGLESTGIDNISTFNGGLGLSIPVGPLFRLNYNSHVWMFEERFDTIPSTIEAVPSGYSNAGLGWTLSLGRLYDKHQ